MKGTAFPRPGGAAPDHRSARAKALEEFLPDADGGKDRNQVAEGQQAGLQGGQARATWTRPRATISVPAAPLSRKFDRVAPAKNGLRNS